MKCPICKRDVADGSPDWPFCGERCKLIDLGVWADEGYRIPTEEAAASAGEHEEDE
jgi:endogenous inhibitor of DNA gyrase (YacG/DUF329 family)